MKIVVDADMCQGHARCYALSPELFDLDELGYAVVRVEVVPEELEEQARQAAGACPERAIRIE